jgi:hypothetical protein
MEAKGVILMSYPRGWDWDVQRTRRNDRVPGEDSYYKSECLRTNAEMGNAAREYGQALIDAQKDNRELRLENRDLRAERDLAVSCLRRNRASLQPGSIPTRLLPFLELSKGENVGSARSATADEESPGHGA